MNTLLQQLNTQTNQINQLQSAFSKRTQYSTDPKMYIILREIDKKKKPLKQINTEKILKVEVHRMKKT